MSEDVHTGDSIDQVVNEAVEAAIRMSYGDTAPNPEHTQLLADVVKSVSTVALGATHGWRLTQAGLRLANDGSAHKVSISRWVSRLDTRRPLYEIDTSHGYESPIIDRYQYGSGDDGRRYVHIQTLNPADGSIIENGKRLTDSETIVNIYESTLTDFQKLANLIPEGLR